MKKILAVLALVTAAAVAIPPDAGAQDHKFKIFAALSYVSPLSDSEIDVGGVTEAVEASSELGYNFGFEFRPSSLLGIELDVTHAEHDLDAETAGVIGSTTFTPICGTLNFHMLLAAIDLYAGPTVGYVNWGDLELESGLDQAVDPAFAWGVSTGAEFRVALNFSLMAGLRWLDVAAEAEDGSEEVDVNPLLARFGAAYRF